MKVTVRKSYYDRDGVIGEKYGIPHYLFRKGDIERITGDMNTPCCLEMAKAIRDNFIGFGEEDTTLNKVQAVCIYHCHPYPEGASWDEMGIKFCPFCGEEILLKEDLP